MTEIQSLRQTPNLDAPGALNADGRLVLEHCDSHPGEEGSQGERDDNGHENTSDAVSKGLDRSLGSLSLVDEGDNVGQSSVRASTGNAEGDGSETVDGTANDLVSDGLGEWSWTRQ
jgi:hypothetical protein